MENVLITSVPIPHICDAIITHHDAETCKWDILIMNSPMGPFDGPLTASLIHETDPTNFKIDDIVKVYLYFIFNPTTGKYEGTTKHTETVILGKCKKPHLSGAELEDDTQDEKRFIHETSRSGLCMNKNGMLELKTPGVYRTSKPKGHGIFKSSISDSAQNFHRIVSNNSPDYSTREHFGLFEGNDFEDEASRASPEDSLFVYRRFVAQSKAMKNWVSTCEGAYEPFLGPNNKSEEVEQRKDVLFSKIVNSDEKRITILAGEDGEGFIEIRVDDLSVSEKSIPGDESCTPGVHGNVFRIKISDEGDLEVCGGGDGRPAMNKNHYKIVADKDGDVKVMASGKIVLTHGDDDESINSIKMDPDNGIDITAKNGFRVNGLNLVNERFLDWMNQFKETLCQTTGPGGPAPIHPAAMGSFAAGIAGKMSTNGFNTEDEGESASGEIKDEDPTYYS